jgi:hypothetical protein
VNGHGQARHHEEDEHEEHHVDHRNDLDASPSRGA